MQYYYNRIWHGDGYVDVIVGSERRTKFDDSQRRRLKFDIARCLTPLLPRPLVASISFHTGGYGYGRRGGCCGNIFGCLCLFVFLGLGCTISGVYYMNAAFIDSRGSNIKTFNSYVDAWEGTAALMSAFTTSVPYSVKFESNASTSLSMDKQETHYDSKKEFGDSSSDLTAGFTSVKFVSGAQSYSTDQPSEINLSIQSKGTDTISGPFSIPQTKSSTWTCNDKADAARGGKCAAGNSCGLDYDQYGCPPSSSSWGPNAALRATMVLSKFFKPLLELW